jgi:hypothetical protein
MKYLWDGHRWIEAAVARAMARLEHGPAVHSDFPDPMMCPADGRYHSTRSSYDAAVRAAGCEIVGKSEMRRMHAQGFRAPPDTSEPVSATLRRVINQHGG